jgi:hypothetical protein
MARGYDFVESWQVDYDLAILFDLIPIGGYLLYYF